MKVGITSKSGTEQMIVSARIINRSELKEEVGEESGNARLK